MQDILFATGHFLQDTFDVLLVPFGNLPNVAFIFAFAFGCTFWLYKQSRLNKKAKRDNTLV